VLVVLGVFVFSKLDIVAKEDIRVRENMFPRLCFSLAIATATFSVAVLLLRRDQVAYAPVVVTVSGRSWANVAAKIPIERLAPIAL
jgi:hypothetical protein